MKIAVAVNARYDRVTGHAGRARHWLIWDCAAGNVLAPPRRIRLEANMVFHHFEGRSPHPLDGIDALIANSSGEGFIAKLSRRGVDVRLSAETDPATAARCYLEGSLSPPRPRPIGALLCKALDRLSPHHDGHDDPH